MSDERINEHIIQAKMKTIREQTGNRDFPPGNRHLLYGLLVQELLTELKRCYEELDVLEELLRTGLMNEEIYNQVKASM